MPKIIASRRGDDAAIASTLARPSVVSIECNPEFLLPLHLPFKSHEQRVHELNVERSPHLRDHHEVEPRRPADDFNNVAMGPFGIEAVDPHGERLVAPIEVVQRTDRDLARFRLPGRRNRVLQVEENEVGGAACRPFEEVLRGSRHREFRALDAGRARAHDRERHGGSFQAQAAGELPQRARPW